jgi:hypothetical protein
MLPVEKFSALNRYKAHLVRLQARRMEKLLLDTHVHDKIDGEEPSLFQVLQMTKRREARTVRWVLDRSRNTVSDHKGILHTCVAHFKEKYGPIQVDGRCVNEMLDAVTVMDTPAYAANLKQPISLEEIVTALKTGGRNKAPGSDAIGLEFYTAHWDTIRPDLQEILNQMFLHKTISPQQKHGLIVSLLKNNGDQTPEGYRPITLLDTDYKLLTRIMAHRLRPFLEDQLQSIQYCCVPGNSIIDAFCIVRDVIAHAEVTRNPLYVLSLDFQNAFVRLSHQYLFQVLRGYAISPWFIERILSLYEHATASVQINGTTAGNISLQSVIRQGCPFSMALYALSTPAPSHFENEADRSPSRTTSAESLRCRLRG